MVELTVNGKDLVDKGAAGSHEVVVNGKWQGFALWIFNEHAEAINLGTILIGGLDLHDAIGIIALQDRVEIGTALLDLRVLHGGVLDTVEVMVPVGSKDELVLGCTLQVEDRIAATIELVNEFDAVLADSIGEGGHLEVEGRTSLIGKELSHKVLFIGLAKNHSNIIKSLRFKNSSKTIVRFGKI